MKRKVSASGIGSLELLLDTICNTFGGILLISLLVAVLLNATSRTIQKDLTPPQSQAMLLATEIERERTAQRLAELRLAVSSRETIVGALLPANLVAEAERLRKEEQLLAELVARKSDKVGGASEAQAKLNEILRDTADLKAKLEQARRNATQLSEQLAVQVAARSQEATIPRLRQVTSLPRAYFIAEGRLFGPWPKRQYGSGNDDDFIQATKNGQQVLLPKPGTGIAIPAEVEVQEVITARFANVDIADEHVKVFIWPDSFGAFDQVRRAIAEKGILLELVPMAADEVVTIGNAPHTPALVQ